MNTTEIRPEPPAKPAPARRAWLGLVFIGMVSLVVMLPLVLIAGCFRVSSETRTMRVSLQESGPNHGVWEKRVEIRAGFLVLGCARVVTSFIDDFPPEAHAVLRAIRGAEVGIYEFRASSETLDRAACIADVTRTMSEHAWERIVAVVGRNETVAIFVPRDSGDDDTLRARVVVLEGRNLIVVSAHVAVEPLLTLVRAHHRDMKFL